MEFIKAILAMFLFAFFASIIVAKSGTPMPSNDEQILSLAIVAAGALVHSEK